MITKCTHMYASVRIYIITFFLQFWEKKSKICEI